MFFIPMGVVPVPNPAKRRNERHIPFKLEGVFTIAVIVRRGLREK
jgi:hypothetical protein